MSTPIQIHQFENAIYPRKLWVAVCDNEEAVNKRFGVDFENSDRWQAYVFSCTDSESGNLGVCCIFRRKKYLTVKNIAHEAVHVASNIFNDCNMTMGFDNGKDEHFAYLVGWVADCINQLK